MPARQGCKRCSESGPGGEPCHRVVSGELADIEQTGLSPGVSRMLAVVAAAAPFDHGQQMNVLAGLKVTTKAVERVSEAIGIDIAQSEQREIGRAVQLDLR